MKSELSCTSATYLEGEGKEEGEGWGRG